ncbi:MAG: FG-GAP repeat protein [Phycisphaerales bacterium]
MSFKSNFTIPAVAAISLCSIGGTTPAYADLGDQLFKLLPDDGAADDRFGQSVAISGATAIVGARRHDDNSSNSGAAYLFATNTGKQLFKLLPDDGALGDGFGGSVAISGATAIVGAAGDDDNGLFAGSAYLFDISDPANPTQIAKLLADDGAELDIFGSSVAISSASAIVGARGDDDNGADSGAAYLFDITTGRQLAKLLPDDGAAGDSFGNSVAISGPPGNEIAIVGAPRVDDDFGSAYVFDISDPANPAQLAKLLPNDGAANDWFGWRVAIRGPTAIVGAPNDDDNGIDSGSAYFFDITTGRQLAKLLPDDGAADDRFGQSVAISGDSENNVAIVGAQWDNDNGLFAGSAYFFDATTGLQLAKVLASDGAEFDSFGLSVAISGTTVIVGAYLHADNGFGSGAAYLFDASFCPWDIDANGSVGAADLLSLLVSWGPCKGCPADFDDSGSVGASDLLALLANWGPCP